MYAVANPEADPTVLGLISKTSPQDALACYYLFDSEESEVIADTTVSGHGFLLRSTNPFDPLRPVVIARASPPDEVRRLVDAALAPGDEYVFVVTPDLAQPLRRVLEVRLETYSAIYAVTRGSFRPHPVAGRRIVRDRSGALKYSVRKGKEVLSSAGVLWASARFAELFVYTEQSDRGKGLGSAVASACTAQCLDQGLTPLYIPEESDSATIAVCRSLGYQPTGHRDFTCIGRVFSRGRSN